MVPSYGGRQLLTDNRCGEAFNAVRVAAKDLGY
jgi:hypothetical protein